ncbi:C40 family peptidase [Effusibacillus pohliae]|uniref:C40 family peptidase n=1 Tax=Effusibacillus pohliae TaxID=232270 RepID=UPI0003814ED3|nr:C40 family peptidase [Effusibacillus pohliae]
MKRRSLLLWIAPFLSLIFGNTPVYAEQPGVADTQVKSASVQQQQMLVNALRHQAILVKDKRVFQQQFLQTAERYAAKSSLAPMIFQSPHAYYCSGFVQQIYRENGIWIPAHSVAQQTWYGIRIASIDKVEPGDLLFFSGAGTSRLPAHVGISLGNGKLLHAAGGHKQISMLPIDEQLRRHFLFATRLVSSV